MGVYDINAALSAAGGGRPYNVGAIQKSVEDIKLAKAQAILEGEKAANYMPEFALDTRKVDIAQQQADNQQKQVGIAYANMLSEAQGRMSENQKRDLETFHAALKDTVSVAQTVLDSTGDKDLANKVGNAYMQKLDLPEGHTKPFNFDIAKGILNGLEQPKQVGVRGGIPGVPGGEAQVMEDPSGLYVPGANGERNRVSGAGMTTGTQKTQAVTPAVDEEIRKKAEGTLNVLDQSKKLISLVKQYPDINTFVSKGASIMNDIKANAIALANQTGIHIDPDVLDPSHYSAQFRELGIQEERKQSAVIGLALAVATSQGLTSKNLSYKELSLVMDQLGAEAQNSDTFAKVLLDLNGRSVGSFNNVRKVHSEITWPNGDPSQEMDQKLKELGDIVNGPQGADTAVPGGGAHKNREIVFNSGGYAVSKPKKGGK